MRKWTLKQFFSIMLHTDPLYFSVSLYPSLLFVQQKMILDISSGKIYRESQITVFIHYKSLFTNYVINKNGSPPVFFSTSKYSTLNSVVYTFEHWTAPNKDKCVRRREILQSSLFINFLLSIVIDNEIIRVNWTQVFIRESSLVYLWISQLLGHASHTRHADCRSFKLSSCKVSKPCN